MNKRTLMVVSILVVVVLLVIFFRRQFKSTLVQHPFQNPVQNTGNNTLPPSVSGTTKIGAHIVLPPGASIDDEIAVLKSLGATYTRVNVGTSNWSTMSKVYDRYVEAGIKVLLNIAWQSSSAGTTAFPTDMNAYASKLSAVLDTLSSKPELIVIENEEINKSFHSGPISDYIEELKTASPIVHAHGLKLTNGGIYGPGLEVSVYRYLQKAHGQAIADNYADHVLGPVIRKAVNNVGSSPELESAVATIQSILSTAPYLDYINVHHYEVDDPNITNVASVTTATPYALKYTKEYIETTTGKPIMSNETSTRDNTQPALVTALLQDYVDNNFPYAIWWDNIDGNKYGGVALNDGTPPFNLRPTGIAFKNFIDQQK